MSWIGVVAGLALFAGAAPEPVPSGLGSTSVLTIRRDLVDDIIAHAKQDHPDEACGVITGPEGSDDPVRLVRMTNAARSPTFFEFDSTEHKQLANELFEQDHEIVVVYHSHTATEAYPSRTDISLAAEPQAHYLLVSTAESGNGDGPVSVRSYRILVGVGGHPDAARQAASVRHDDAHVRKLDDRSGKFGDGLHGGLLSRNQHDPPG